MQIEKNIPIPVAGKYSAIFRKMDVGDSVLLDVDKRYNLHPFAVRSKIKITMRREAGKTRVWRIE